MPVLGTQNAYLYEKIVSNISELIQAGTYRPGERIPSVRKLSKQEGISISTVLQAYLVLENMALIARA